MNDPGLGFESQKITAMKTIIGATGESETSFHTSLFITNLASINTNYIYHHCYEFGTTSVFICMGKPEQDPLHPDDRRKKRMPLGVVMDERIATGIEYSRFFAAFMRYLKTPEVLEKRLDGKGIEEPMAVEA